MLRSEGLLLAGSSARSGGFARTSAAFFLAGVCAVAATFWIIYPGFVGFDAADQFQQAMLGRYIYWHPPLMSAVWRLLLPIAPGQIGMVLLSHTFVYAALAVVLHRLLRSPVAFVLAGVALLSPPIFAPFFTLSKDAFAFASLVLGLFFLAGAFGKDGWAQRLPFEAVALVLLVLAAMLRFELAPVAGVLIALHVLATLCSGGRWWAALRLARMAVLGVFLTGVFAVGVKALDDWISFGVLGAERRYPETTLILHNLAAISVRTGENLIPASRFVGEVDFGMIETRLHPAAGDSIIWRPDATLMLDINFNSATAAAELRRAWVAAIVEHPVVFLQHRLAFGAHLLGFRPWPWSQVLDPVPLAQIQHDVICDGWGFSAAMGGRDNCTPSISPALAATYRVAAWFESRGLLRGYVAIIILAVCTPLLAIYFAHLRRDRTAAWLVVLLGLACFGHAVMLVLVAPSVQQRYLGLLGIVSTIMLLAMMSAAAQLIAEWHRARRQIKAARRLCAAPRPPEGGGTS